MTLGAWRNAARSASAKRGRIGVQFALVNGRFLVTMQKLDGIFDGEDVIGLLLIHFVEDGGERGGFAGAGGAGDEDDAVAQLHDFLRTSGGRFSSAKPGILSGMTRMTMAQLPRWRKILTRKRPTPASP